ncbi:hypothetical protein MWU52_06080 [Jannaschia sp. S6380]|uniref:hypothetical protein n=1 Tax=Jannaschia sp. S6380 TaxID=2926408 RepID=UPI001FF15382|nr:hypothetical protein [Jannaschia sp. S6380]MCK0167113.1 hypothetical protein [Jannaschia sp. S6380]
MAAIGCAMMSLAGLAEAQTRTVANTPGPAETPAASFEGDRYVDSEGCVFIRAGIGGATRWVPQVNRDRTVVCGQTPSVAAAADVPEAPVRAVEPVLRRRPAAAAARVAAESLADPAPAIMRTPGTPEAAPRPQAPVAAVPRVTTTPAIPGRTIGGAVVIRVAEPAGARRIDAATPSPDRLRAPVVATRADRTVVVPVAKHTFHVPQPPAGYRAAWSDGRINPARGPRTLQGDYQTQGVWTNQTPRRLQPVIRVAR